MLVRVRGVIEQGSVCLGALDEFQKAWVTPADSSPQEIAIDTANNRSVTIVFANCMSASPAPVPTRFTLESVSYGVLAPQESRP